MVNLQVASRYAKSLLQLAIEQGLLDRVYADMVLFNQLCTEHKRLVETLQSPIVPKQQKLGTLKDLLADQVHALTLRLFDIVVQRNREGMLPAIAFCFFKEYDAYQDIKTASITTTFPLTSDLIAYFKTLVQSIAPCKEVRLIQQVKPAILGGFILQIEDKRLDESLINKLYLLKKQGITSGYDTSFSTK